MRRAFTLIELLVVIAIVCVLVAIVLPTLAGTRAAAREQVCRSNLRSLMQMASAHRASVGTLDGFAPGEDAPILACPIDPQARAWSYVLYDDMLDPHGRLINWENVRDQYWLTLNLASDQHDFRHGLKVGEVMNPDPFSEQWERSWRNKARLDGSVTTATGPLSTPMGTWMP